MQTIDIKTASWQADHLVLEKVRVVVFVQEQNVPVDIEMDDRDAFCVHVLARHRRRPVGTGRIDIEKHGKIGRVAVLPEYRAQGMGKALMVALEAIADQPDRPIKDGEEALVEELALVPPSVLVAMDPMAGLLVGRWAPVRCSSP